MSIPPLLEPGFRNIWLLLSCLRLAENLLQINWSAFTRHAACDGGNKGMEPTMKFKLESIQGNRR
jgi:hypothetical protein